jgi:hypothetical protein
MSRPLTPTSVRRQSIVKFDTISIILDSQRYKKRVALKRNLEVKTRHRIELEARNMLIRSRLISLKGNTRLLKPKYQRLEYQKSLLD